MEEPVYADATEGEPLLRRSRPYSPKTALFCIMLLEFLRAIGYNTVLPYIIPFMRAKFDFTGEESVKWYLVFQGIVYLFPSLSGALGDVVIGRYKSMLISQIIYFIGSLILLALAVLLWKKVDIGKEPIAIMLVLSLLFIAVGYGSVIPSTFSLGAEQVTSPTTKNIWSFFMWKHWCFSLGKYISFLPIPYLLQETSHSEVLFPKALVMSICVGLSVVIVICSRSCYKRTPPMGKDTFERLKKGFARFLPCFCREGVTFHFVRTMDESTERKRRLERQYNGYLLKKVILLSALFSTFGFHSVVYSQQSSTYVLQANNLRNTSTGSDKVPLGGMNMITPAVVLLIVPLLEIYNRLKGLLENLNDSMDIALFGGICDGLSPYSAAVLETFVRRLLHNTSGEGRTHISIWAQAPQYILVGISDVMCYIPVTEFAYKESPRHIEGFMTGMTFSAASFLALILSAFETLLFNAFVKTKDPLKRLELHFYSLACMTVTIYVLIVLPFVHIYRKFVNGTFIPTERRVVALDMISELQQ